MHCGQEFLNYPKNPMTFLNSITACLWKILCYVYVERDELDSSYLGQEEQPACREAYLLWVQNCHFSIQELEREDDLGI